MNNNMCLSRPPAGKAPPVMGEWLGTQHEYKQKNIEPVGDP